MTCALCGGDHRGWETAVCRKNRMVVHVPVMVVHKEPDTAPMVVHASRHGKHINDESRKAYRRDWMRAKRLRDATPGG